MENTKYSENSLASHGCSASYSECPYHLPPDGRWSDLWGQFPLLVSSHFLPDHDHLQPLILPSPGRPGSQLELPRGKGSVCWGSSLSSGSSVWTLIYYTFLGNWQLSHLYNLLFAVPKLPEGLIRHSFPLKWQLPLSWDIFSICFIYPLFLPTMHPLYLHCISQYPILT